MANYAKMLKEQLGNFLSELSEILEEDPIAKSDITMVRLFFSAIPEQKLMEHFIKYAVPYEEKIRKRQDSFFIENTGLFKGLPDNKVKMVSNFWVSGKFSDEDKDIIWQYFDCFLELVRSHQKHK